MMLGVLAAAIRRPSTGDSAPEVVAFSGTSFSTATSVSQTIPAATEAGDIIIACVMSRAELTPPSGWTLVLDAEADAFPTIQKSSIFIKTATAYDAGISATWTQASDARCGLHLIVARGGGPLSVKQSASRLPTGSGLTWAPIAPVTASTSGQLAVAMASWLYALTEGESTCSVSPPWIQTTPASSTDLANQIRMGVAYKTLNTGETASGEFVDNTNESNADDWASVTVLIGYA